MPKPCLDVKLPLTSSSDGFLDNFGPELGSQIVVHFPKLGILKLLKFACIAQVAFDAVFGSFLDAIRANLGVQF